VPNGWLTVRIRISLLQMFSFWPQIIVGLGGDAAGRRQPGAST